MALTFDLSPRLQESILKFECAYNNLPEGMVEKAEKDTHEAKTEFRNRYFTFINTPGRTTADIAKIDTDIKAVFPKASEKTEDWKKKETYCSLLDKDLNNNTSVSTFQSSYDFTRERNHLQGVDANLYANKFANLRSCRKEFKKVLKTELKGNAKEEILKFMNQNKISAYIVGKFQQLAGK